MSRTLTSTGTGGIPRLDPKRIAEHADDPSTDLDDRWGELEIPILYFGATGMGPGWLVNGIYSAGESGSKDVTIHVLEGYGHLDVIVGEKSRGDVFEPALTWMRERTARPSGVSSR